MRWSRSGDVFGWVATRKEGRLTVVKHDLLDVGEGTLAGLRSCWITLFDIALGVITYELIEVVEACKLGKDMEIDIFPWLSSGWKG